MLSSRARLARNVASFRYPARLAHAEQIALQEALLQEVTALPAPDLFSGYALDSMEEWHRHALVERGVVSRGYVADTGRALALGASNGVGVTFNDRDHLRLSAIGSGLALQDNFAAVSRVEASLEATVSYAASLEWGYLTSSPRDTGTGLRVSVGLHVPALVMTGGVDSVLRIAARFGLRVSRFLPGGPDDIVLLSNKVALGILEGDITIGLEEATGRIVRRERRRRQSLLVRRRLRVEDRIWRAHGLLTTCRRIGQTESLELLSWVRLGATIGILEEGLSVTATRLFFETQRAHLLGTWQTGGSEGHGRLDVVRATHIRAALTGRN